MNHLASKNDDGLIAAFLIKSGANVNHINSFNATALQYAAINGKYRFPTFLSISIARKSLLRSLKLTGF